MRAQAVIAVDGPNVLVTMNKLFGRDAKLNHQMLRDALVEDARQRLGVDDLDVKAAVFLQSSSQSSQDNNAGPTEGRVRFESMLADTGWQVLIKPPADYPEDLVAVSRGLDRALSTRGSDAVRDVKRSMRELEAARDADCSCVASNAQSKLRESARTLTKVYGTYYNLSTRLVMRVLLPLLVRFSHFQSPRRMLEKLLIKAWSNISLAELGQDEYMQRVREQLVVAYTSPLNWRGKSHDVLVDPAMMPRMQLLDHAQRVRKALTAQRDELHRIGDVDDLLSEWTRSQVKPDLASRDAKLPAVVYLVGNDYRNHLVLAERLRRYGAEVVLVLQPCHLARTPADKKSEVEQYPRLALDAFVDVGCTGKVAA